MSVRHKIALGLFALLLLMRTVISVNSIFNGRSVLITADGIPVDTYPPAAAQTIVSLFALMAMGTFTICVLGVIALIRIRTLIPLLYALLLLQHLGGRVILHYLPLVRVGAPPAGMVNLILLVMMVVGLVLSLGRMQSET